MGSRIFLSIVVAAAAALFYSTFFFKKSLVGASSSPEGMPRFVLTGIIVVDLLLLARDWKNACPRMCGNCSKARGSMWSSPCPSIFWPCLGWVSA